MKKSYISYMVAIIQLIILVNLASALVVSNVEQETLYPGEQTQINIGLANNLNDDVTDVSFSLDLSSTKFITIGSSQESDDEIREDKDRTFSFIIKSSPDIKPGDYNIPYKLVYSYQDKEIEKDGTIGISVGARTDIEYSIKTENPIIGQKGKINFIVTNKGLGDLKFVLVKATPSGFGLISSSDSYIGTINSDDFESANFDVIFNSNSPRFIAIVEYKDVENKEIIETIDLPIKVYTNEEAIKMGILNSNNNFIYVILLILLIIIFVIWRIIKSRKKRKANKGP